MSGQKRKGVWLRKQTQRSFPLAPTLNFLPRPGRMTGSAASLNGQSCFMVIRIVHKGHQYAHMQQ